MRKLDPKKRSDIIKAARKRFQRKGLTGTTMASIASDVDIAVGTLYLYFKDKKSLVLACVDLFIQDHRAEIEKALSEKGRVGKRLEQYIFGRFEAARATREGDSAAAELTRYVMKVAPDRRNQESTMMISTVAELLSRGKASGEFPGVDSIEEETFVFLHAVAWFFPIATDEFRDPPNKEHLGKIIHWFLKRWMGA